MDIDQEDWDFVLHPGRLGRSKTLWLWHEGFWLNSINDAYAEKLRPPTALDTNIPLL